MDHDSVPNKFVESLHASRDPIFAVNGKQEIRVWTEGMARLTGRTAQEVRGKPCFEVLQGTDRFGNAYCCPRCPIVQMIERGEAIHPFEFFIRSGSDEQTRRHIRCSHLLMTDQKDSSTLCIYMVEDLTEESARSGKGLAVPLSDREREVLRCLTQGMDPPGIARTLGIRDTTLRNHIQRILKKLGVHSRTEAVAQAYRQELV